VIRISGSSAQRVDVCPASGTRSLALMEHESADADAGSALHEHTVDRGRLGATDALERLDEVFDKWNVDEDERGFLRARLLRWEWVPPRGAVMELRLALMPDGNVVRVGKDERYHAEALITGQFDIAWSEPTPLIIKPNGAIECDSDSVLWVMDLKTGNEAWVHTVETNLQTAIYAALMARFTKAERVVPGIIYPAPGPGIWDVMPHAWGEREVDAVLARVLEIRERVNEVQGQIDRGEPFRLTEGRHCQYCQGRGRCPAKVALFRSVLAKDGAAIPVPWGPGGLTEADAVRLAESLGQLEHFRERARAALEIYVQDNGPIPLGDGLVWGPMATKSKRINGKIALPILKAELGEESIELKVTGADIERAVKAKLAGARGAAPMVRSLYAKIGEAGGITEKAGEQFCVHRPEPQLQTKPEEAA
jgi:hypothetical protein